MKKKLLFGLLCVAQYSYAQPYFQNEETITTTGSVHRQVSDIEYNPDYDMYRSLHKTSKGMGVFTYDGNANYTSVLEIYKTNYPSFNPVRIIDNANLTHILFWIGANNQHRYGVIQYDNTTNTINWVKGLSNSTNNIDCQPKDMDIDYSTGDLYITGDQMDPNTFEYDIFVAKINSLGVLQWHNKYPHINRDEFAFSVFYHSPSAIYVGAVSHGTASALDKKAIILEVNSSGAVGNETSIIYNSYNNCNYYRMGSASVKRNGNDVFVFIPSFAGSDGAGCLSLFKLDASLSVTDFKMFGSNLIFYDPLFEFTDNGNNIAISGHRRIMATTSNLGYATYSFSTSGFYNMGGQSYPNTVHDFWGPALIRTVYNGYSDELVAVMDYYTYQDRFHVIRSNRFGKTFTDCDNQLDGNYCDCQYSIKDPNVTGQAQTVIFNTANNIFIANLAGQETNICLSADCPECRMQKENIELVGTAHANVSPNPAVDRLNIRSSQAVSKAEVFDVNGQIVLSFDLNSTECSLDVSGIEPGVYILRLTDVNEHVSTGRIVKQ